MTLKDISVLVNLPLPCEVANLSDLSDAGSSLLVRPTTDKFIARKLCAPGLVCLCVGLLQIPYP